MDPAAPRILRPQGSGRFVLLCDHASNYIPAELHDLGLPASELARHIAWDIGAAGVTEALSEIFDAPAILSTPRAWSSTATAILTLPISSLKSATGR